MPAYVHDTQFFTRRTAVLVAIVALHLFILWALATGLARKAIEVLAPPIQTDIVQEEKTKSEPPPPPPPEMQKQGGEGPPAGYHHRAARSRPFHHRHYRRGRAAACSGGAAPSRRAGCAGQIQAARYGWVLPRRLAPPERGGHRDHSRVRECRRQDLRGSDRYRHLGP